MTRNDDPTLAEAFEAHRSRLRSVATRMLGSASEADDAVQETWLRFSRTDTSDVERLGSWLTTVVSRVCLNQLEARRRRSGVTAEPDVLDSWHAPAADAGPEDEALLADAVGLALMVVLDSLTPPERVAFVLHDLFGVPFEEVAQIVGRTAVATRQLASRARRSVRDHDRPDAPDRLRHATLVEAFLAAARGGEFEGLLAVLDPDAVLRGDDSAVALGAPREACGSREAARFLRRARAARPALADGVPVAVWMPGDEVRVMMRFTVRGDRITTVDLVADPTVLRETDLVLTDC